MGTIVRWAWFALCFATLAVFVAAPTLAQRGEAKYKKGDKVEVEDGFEWKAGTVVRTNSMNGWVEVRLDEEDETHRGAPKNMREMMRTRPYPPHDVRPTAGGAGGEKPVRRWSDRTGKFSINARFDGLNNARVGLLKADGKRLEVPLEKLSDVDQKYVEKQTAEGENPFGESANELADESEPAGDVRKANWREVRAVRPQKFSKWSFAPRTGEGSALLKLTGAPGAEVTLNEIPDSQKFFEKVDGIYVTSDGTRAVVCRTEGAVSQNNPQYLEAVDLKASKVSKLVPLPESTAVLDIDH